MSIYEKSDCDTHEIMSPNILCCSDTGRVIAVFYNSSDIDKILQTEWELEAANEAIKFLWTKSGSATNEDYQPFMTAIELALKE
jgi:hypothetical protein